MLRLAVIGLIALTLCATMPNMVDARIGGGDPNEACGTGHTTLVSMDTATVQANAGTLSLTLDNTVTLSLAPLTVWAPGAQRTVVDGQGNVIERFPLVDHSFNGTVVGEPESSATLTLTNVGIYGSIRLPGTEYYLSPTSDLAPATGPAEIAVNQYERGACQGSQPSGK